MQDNKKAASGATNTTDSKSNQSIDSVAQPKGGVNPAGQYTAIRMAYHAAEKLAREKDSPSILSQRVDTLVEQFAPYGFTREQIVTIGSGSFGNDNDADFSKPTAPVPERRSPVKWTDAMVRTLKNMLNDGRKPAEIAKLMNLERTQVVTKINALKKAAPQVKESTEIPDKPAPAPASEPAPQVKAVPELDLTAVNQPIGEHLDIFSTLQGIMRQAGAGYVSVNITRQDGTKLRAEVHK